MFLAGCSTTLGIIVFLWCHGHIFPAFIFPVCLVKVLRSISIEGKSSMEPEVWEANISYREQFAPSQGSRNDIAERFSTLSKEKRRQNLTVFS